MSFHRLHYSTFREYIACLCSTVFFCCLWSFISKAGWMWMLCYNSRWNPCTMLFIEGEWKKKWTHVAWEATSFVVTCSLVVYCGNSFEDRERQGIWMKSIAFLASANGNNFDHWWQRRFLLPQLFGEQLLVLSFLHFNNSYQLVLRMNAFNAWERAFRYRVQWGLLMKNEYFQFT